MACNDGLAVKSLYDSIGLNNKEGNWLVIQPVTLFVFLVNIQMRTFLL